MSCTCWATTHDCGLIVVTGGPGAGKTALLEIVRRNFCEHVAILPEAASIIYGGGFPRKPGDIARRAGQRAIFHTQCELERLTIEEQNAAVALCDRGTLDGLAYWPGDPAPFWREVRSSREAQLARYRAVIHLRTPPAGEYNHRNHLRTESAHEAAEIDERIAAAWQGHPRVYFVDHAQKFIDKVGRALEIIREELPTCCRRDAQTR
jgi:predicted ATPase